MKLTEPQQHVVNVLKSNEGSYLIRSKLYHWSKIWSASGRILLEDSVWKPTVDSLCRKDILISFSNMLKYKLNEQFIQ